MLFERVLAQGTLDTTDSLEVWNKFLEFESNIGDLASVVKVEKRRSAVMEEAGLSQGKPTVQVIDRYRFMSLMPLSSEELKSIGYQSVALSLTSRGGSLPRLFIIHKAGRFSHFIHFKLRFNAQSRSEPSVLPEIKETHFQTKVLKTEYLRRDQNRTVSSGLKHDLSDASACLYLIVSTPDGPNMFSPGTGNQFVLY